jgi:RND family efflux transporter MFP subunit
MLLHKPVLIVTLVLTLGFGISSVARGEQPPAAKVAEVQVRHPKQAEAAPTEQFIGHLGKAEGEAIAVIFAVDERSYLKYQRLLEKRQVKGPGSDIDIGLANEKGFQHKGTLKSFDDEINPDTGTVHAHATMPNASRRLLPGMSARVRMPVGPLQNVLQVPEEAVLSDRGNRYVLVINSDDIVEKRGVSLGAVDGTMRTIVNGINADDCIVIGATGGLNTLTPGAHVKRRIVDDAPEDKK